MKQVYVVVFGLIVLLLVGSQISTPLLARSGQVQEAAGVLVFSIPIGDANVHYRGTGTAETEASGPSTLRIAEDGTFLIPDTVGRRIVRLASDGSVLKIVQVDAANAITAAESVDVSPQAVAGNPAWAPNRGSLNSTAVGGAK